MNYDRIYSTVLLTTSLDEHGRQASAGRCSVGLPQAQHRPMKRLSAATSLPYSNSLSLSFRGINAITCLFLTAFFRLKKMCQALLTNSKHKEPVYSEADRVRILKALKVVDDAILVDLNTTNDKMLALEKFHFNVLFSGDDWRGTERYNKTEQELATLGVCIEYFPYTQGISSSKIKEKLQNE